MDIETIYQRIFSILRKVNEIGMKAAYETNNAVRDAVRCIPALAVVPKNDVIAAFDFLVNDIGECLSFCHISKLLTSVDEDSLEKTPFTDHAYFQLNVGINIKLQLTALPEQPTQ